MNTMEIKPRIKNITSFITRSELKNPKIEDNIKLPERILAAVGNVNNISFPQQGMCSLVSIIDSDSGRFILKVSKGEYRGRELYAEYEAVKALRETNIPVPVQKDFFQEGNMYYLLREYSEGTPLNTIFNESRNKKGRLYMIEEMARALREIHNINKNSISFEEFIKAQFYFAEEHYKNNTIDILDFVFDGKREEPQDVMKWLKENIPKGGKTCLIHGDYRPKNMLWKNNKITSIIDWAFCDIGDPYYDFAMLFDYFIDDEERQAFLKAYGIKSFDEQRLRFYTRMIPFINI